VVLPDRWTVLHHDPSFTTTRGVVPESWLCVDCGFNTVPGFKTRKEMDEAFFVYGEKSVPQTYTADQEVYTVTDKVWRQTGLEGWGGCLCIGCLEKRIGRRLKPKDFSPDHPFNQPNFPASQRLRKRRGG
jgi:hypothetical protein